MEKRNYKIYAVDFDGTLCENAWREIGKAKDTLINRMIELREEGNKVILWTCRTDDKLTNAIDWCKEHGLEFDAINENVPEILETFGTEARKIYADVYVDDRAVDLEVISYWFD